MRKSKASKMTAMTIPDSLTYAWAVPASMWLFFWVAERCYSFALSEDGISVMNGWIFTPNYANGTAWMDGNELLDQFYSAFYQADLRFYLVRTHIYMASFSAIIIVLNLFFGKELAKARKPRTPWQWVKESRAEKEASCVILRATDST